VKFSNSPNEKLDGERIVDGSAKKIKFLIPNAATYSLFTEGVFASEIFSLRARKRR